MIACEKNSSMVIAAISTLLLTSNLAGYYSNSCNNTPVIRDVKLVENNSMPVYYIADKYNIGNSQSRFDEAFELFGEVRGFTKEEAILYEESLSNLYIETGDNFFDL